MPTSKRPTRYPSLALLLFLIGFLILLGACRPGAPSEPGTAGGTVRRTSRLVILHTNDTWGYYDPCG